MHSADHDTPTCGTRAPEVPDEVVLLGAGGEPIGAADRRTVHGADTPLHLAFSAYLYDDAGRLLVTRRALDKTTWPGVWTNSCCGHPRPGESVPDAITRRAVEELGASAYDLEPLLPDFAYRAVDAGGIVENEVCPVYVGRIATSLRPDPAEIVQVDWTTLPALVAATRATPFAFSPWCVAQLALMVERGLV